MGWGMLVLRLPPMALSIGLYIIQKWIDQDGSGIFACSVLFLILMALRILGKHNQSPFVNLYRLLVE